MTYTPGNFRSRSKTIIDARKSGVSLLMAITGAGLIASEARSTIQTGSTVEAVFYIGLLSATSVLILAWIWVCQHELDLLIDWLDPEYYHPPFSIKEVGIIILCVPVLASLVLSAKKPYFFAIAFTIYSILALLGYLQLLRYYSEIFPKCRTHLERQIGESSAGTDHSVLAALEAKCYLEVVDVLEKYFFDRKYTFRLEMIVVSSLIVLSVATMARIYDSSALENIVSASYIGIIITSEFLIAKWRVERDNKIRKVAADLGQMQREPEVQREVAETDNTATEQTGDR